MARRRRIKEGTHDRGIPRCYRLQGRRGTPRRCREPDRGQVALPESRDPGELAAQEGAGGGEGRRRERPHAARRGHELRPWRCRGSQCYRIARERAARRASLRLSAGQGLAGANQSPRSTRRAMSGIDLLSLLQRWPGRWGHAELWRIACGAAPPDGEVIARSVLESISRPLDPLEVFRRLLDDGAFSAAEALLEYPPFADAVDDTLIALGSELDLDNRRFQVRGQFLSALDVLLMRNQRAGSPIAADDPRLAEALEWSSHDKKRADRLLMEIENALRDAEIERVALLRPRLPGRAARAGGDVPASWRDAVERCLDQRQMDIAEALISGPFGDAADADGALPLPLENARFANISAAQLCRWILGREAATSGFFPRWDVLSIDAANRSLIETIERLAGAGTSVDDVARLAGELQTRLNVVAARAAVERFGDVYRTALRGLEDEACPVFAEGAVPFFVAGEGAIPDEATRGVPLAIVFHTGRELQAPVGYVRLTAWDIVRCLVRPDDFGFNLLRILASQVSRHRFIPQRDRSPNNWMARARSADARNVPERANRIPQLVSGAAGVGKTSLLMSFLDAFDGKGWTCRFISSDVF